MKDLLKNIMYAGIGAAFLTRDKLEEAGRQLTEKGCMSVEEGKDFVEELLKKSEAAKKQMEQRIGCLVEEGMKKCRCASAGEIAELRRKVDELQAALNALSREEQGSQQDSATANQA